MEIIVDPGSIGSLHEYFCGKTKLVLTVSSRLDSFLSTPMRFKLTFLRVLVLLVHAKTIILKQTFLKKDSRKKENFKNAHVTATHSLLGENKREHHYTSVNGLRKRAYRKIRRRLSLDCCKNKCANAGTLSLIAIRFCQYSTPLGGF